MECNAQNPGQNTYRSTLGFLSTSLDGLDLALKAVMATRPWLSDPAVVPIPYRQDVVDAFTSRANPDGTPKDRPFQIGILWADGVVEPHPPIRRGLQLLANAVKSAGHELADWEPPSHLIAQQIHLSFLLADGGDDVNKHVALSGEPIIPQLAATFKKRDPLPLLTYQDLTIKGLDFENKYSDYWNATAVDAVIMPVAPTAAVIPGKYFHVGYTQTINLLNYSAVVVPVTVANKAVDIIDGKYEPVSEVDRMNWEACKFLPAYLTQVSAM